VAALARISEAPDEVVEEIKLAVSEACTGAVSAAAAAGGSDEPVRVTATIDASRIVIDVFDPRGSAPRPVAGPPSDIDTGDLPFEQALSLPLIRGLVDELSLIPREGGGLRMQMIVGIERTDG
jgi:anti-sigma regulatory factor (Ser/Thr protein kinase)